MSWIGKVWSRHERTPSVAASHPVDPVAIELLHQLTGHPGASFRDDQWEVIDALVNRGERILLVQRTGWGKSAVYFVSAKILRNRGRGPTVIISPLLSLMRNQVMAGRRMGLRIGALHSGTSHRFEDFQRMVLDDTIDVLLIAPERFASERFRDDLLPDISRHMGMLVIDEAHCVSDWGHDYRPDYLRLGSILQYLPRESPLLATTATANQRVVMDIQGQLGALRIIRGSLARENLSLQVMDPMSVKERFAWLAAVLPTLQGQGIVYTLTRQDADDVAGWLRDCGIDARAYHSGSAVDGRSGHEDARVDLEEHFTRGDLKVLVATSALGMGYDNPQVRFVVHYQTPSSILGYYQQVGRAGRGKERALGILMSGPEDAAIQELFRTSSLPTVDERAWVVAALKKVEPASVSMMTPVLNLPEAKIDHTLRFLSVQANPLVSREGDTWTTNKVLWDTTYGSRRDALVSIRREEWEGIQDYQREKRDCQMLMLLRGVNDLAPARRCGHCANCLGKPLVSHEIDDDMQAKAERFLLRPSTVLIPAHLHIPENGLPRYGFSGAIPLNRQAREGRAMTYWGIHGLGLHVGDGKRSGRFNDVLVDAMVGFLSDVWHPDPKPVWMTCIPSLRHPELVPDFARRVAELLGIPFAMAVAKVRDVEPQKQQDNDVHQCRNLDGVFAISLPTNPGPVLLMDDMVDSGWTFAIVAMLLQRAGSGPVFPLALASTRSREEL